MDKSIQLVNDLRVDIDNISKDFPEQIKAAFDEYTSMTAKDYRYEDKLRFIDLCVDRLHGNEAESETVNRLVLEQAEFRLTEYGELPDADDYNSLEFMEHCVKEGHKLSHLHFVGDLYKMGEKKMRVLELILSALYGSDKEDCESDKIIKRIENIIDGHIFEPPNKYRSRDFIDGIERGLYMAIAIIKHGEDLKI